MKNIFGDEIDPAPLEFEWPNTTPKWHLWVYRRKVPLCHVSPNGCHGTYIRFDTKLGEPVLQASTGPLSFSDMTAIMAEYWRELTPKQVVAGVITAIANERKISYDEAVAYIVGKYEVIDTAANPHTAHSIK